jgi:hypothetical protein
VRQGETVRSFVALLSIFALAACRTAPPARTSPGLQGGSPDSAVAFLLAAAATDFQTHRPPQPLRFRDVRSGYAVTSAGTKQYRLCGEFLPAPGSGTSEWTLFATIRTSGYEQMLGAQAVASCRQSSVRWDKEDLSSSLQSRLDSLR